MLEDKNAFGFVRHNPRPPKPRKVGVTEIRGPYYSAMGKRYLQDGGWIEHILTQSPPPPNTAASSYLAHCKSLGFGVIEKSPVHRLPLPPSLPARRHIGSD
ncbi:hypothetical protein B0H65DRAFT_548286 [Neurospora tetraspora]|uniref:Uncharacterized protein n=1 Tax=Neurospora tetraspora TaxID=94610 RepID=A0AAE0JIG2_9PEZI|nr:hypothetical protein B0H65DRAFT_548286 [Neurospora tetraspora]